MNDCLYSFIGACKGNCKKCQFKYISVNTSKEGSKLYDEYQEECKSTFTALREKYLKKANDLPDNK